MPPLHTHTFPMPPPPPSPSRSCLCSCALLSAFPPFDFHLGHPCLQSAILSAGLLVASGAAYAFTEQPVWALLAALALLPLTLPELGSLSTAREITPVFVFASLLLLLRCSGFWVGLFVVCAGLARTRPFARGGFRRQIFRCKCLSVCVLEVCLILDTRGEKS